MYCTLLCEGGILAIVTHKICGIQIYTFKPFNHVEANNNTKTLFSRPMKLASILVMTLLTACISSKKAGTQPLPGWMKGSFADDYDLRYTITDTLFSMDGVGKYHILNWNAAEQYLIVRNDSANKSEKGLYSRIDYMKFENMEPFKWGYCLTIYNAPDTASARNSPPADRQNPKKGCKGYPFSRMKKNE